MSLHGVAHHLQTLEGMDKLRATNMVRRGVEYGGQSSEAKAKRQVTCLQDYGFSHPSKSPEVQAKRVATFQRRYGVDHQLQIPSVAKRVFYPKHSLATYLGQSVAVMSSYEERVFAALVRSGCIVKSGHEFCIDYTNPVTNKPARYYPDLYADSKDGTRILIEVKSAYTLERDLTVNLAKFKAANRTCRKSNVQFYLAVIDKDKLHKLEHPTKTSVRKLLRALSLSQINS
jgi:hypothetical protein